jgi:hypothetical protein
MFFRRLKMLEEESDQRSREGGGSPVSNQADLIEEVTAAVEL